MRVMRSPDVEPYTISWIRVYPSVLSPSRVLIEQATEPSDDSQTAWPPNVVWEEGDRAFFDVQALRRRHVACTRLNGLAVSLPLPAADASFHAPVSVHLLLHMTGLVAYRLTVRGDQATRAQPASVEDFHRFHACMWRDRKATWTYSLGREDVEVECDVRGFMDRLFFEAHELAQGRPAPAKAAIEGWTADADSRYRRFEELVEQDGLLSAYPVAFGTHYELQGVEPQFGEALALEQSLALTAPNVVPAGSTCDWYMTENKSVLVTRSDDRPVAGADVIDPSRTRLLEYLTLRRAALRTVQRATQHAITEGERVDRPRIAQWERLIASLSDEYVLHDDIGAVYKPLKRHLRESDALRDLSELESQVRMNVDSFGAQLDAATDRAGLLLGALFGVVAATSLAPLAQHLASLTFGLPRTQDRFVQSHLAVAAALEVALIVVVVLIAYGLYRRVTRRPFQRRRD